MLEYIQRNVTTIKYALIIINIFFMIIAIKAVVNYQNILISIDTIQEDIQDKNDHTDYINNFVTPYLQSEYAPYFFAHENNQIFPGEKIIKLVEIDTGALANAIVSNNITGDNALRTSVSAQQSRSKYRQNIIKNIKIGL